jgi:HTH-type transcriptional regulator / antitoxin HipB
MSTTYPIRFANQMREHLRSLRKQHGLTQAQLGALAGVSQARIAEIEAKPGLVNFDQMLQLLSLLGAGLSLDVADEPATETAPSPRHTNVRKKRGSW